jgi:hypothetical protein
MNTEPFNQKKYNLRGLAQDQWILSMPDDDADPYKTICPCGCGKKWKFCLTNLKEHEERFINEYIQKHST